MANDICAKNIVGVSGFIRDLKVAYATKKCRLYESKPGQGKTTIAKQFFKQLLAGTGNTVHYMNVGIKPEEMIGGIIMPSQPGRCSLQIPEFWDKVKPGDVVIFDELDKKRHDQQNVYLELSQTGTLDGNYIGEGQVLYIFLANRSTDRGGSYGVSPLIGNRVGVREFRPADSEVLDYMAEKGTHYLVQTYLRTHPGSINPEYLTTRLRNSTSRSWEECSDDLYALGENPNFQDVIVTVASRHPDSVAQDFEMYAEMGHKLIPIEEVLANPKKARVPDKNDRALGYLQLIMCCSKVQAFEPGRDRGKAKAAIWEYSKRFSAEFRSAIMPYMLASPLPSELIGSMEGEGNKTTDLKELIEWKQTRERILNEGK